MKKKVIIMGAAGRDFQNFNIYFRNNEDYEVVCFTATQIPDIAGRKYPKELSGKFYPKGIPIYVENDLPKLIKKFNVDQCILAYSDLPHMHVMHKSSIVNAAGADFILMGTKSTMLKSTKKVVSVCAVRTGCGKSQTSRQICNILRKMEKKIVVVRHPMPYGDLKKQICQRFEKYSDFDKYKCTIEEREEYEPHIERGEIVYAGVDYEKILRKAEKEADVIVWDGGNNDFPFYKPDLHIVLVDPHRPGHEISYYPGEANLRMADVVVINKEKTAVLENIEIVKNNIKKVNSKALVIDAYSKITVDRPDLIRGKRVLVIEDGPTLTHGDMKYGAGTIAAKRLGCEIVDPRKCAVGSIKKTFEKFKHLGNLLPAMGYSPKQINELKKTINKTKADAVVVGTPIDLRKILKMNKPAVRIKYELIEMGNVKLEHVLDKYLK